MRRLLARLFARRSATLSKAAAGDAADMARLHAASFGRGWSEGEIEALLREPAVLAHRALAGRTVAGFIMSRRAAGEAEILSVAVGSRYRGQGLAGRLLGLHLGTLVAMGVQTVFLEVGEDNTPARRLYARAGFRDVGRRESYYREAGRATAALVLRRDLA